ncbi:hypothetical protein [Mycoplasma suis]|nr:hypothetical protein [Mycoplasma suis]
MKKLKDALEKLQESNRQLITKLEEDIKNLPNKIFEGLEEKEKL